MQRMVVRCAVWAVWVWGCSAALLSAQKASPYPATGEHSGAAWFVDVAGQAGIRVRNVNGNDATKRYIVESTGSGVAIIDYDRDGWPDIFVVNGQELTGADRTPDKESPFSHLFHNNHNGTFTDVTDEMGLKLSGWGQGVCVDDYDNDGYDDLFVTFYGHNHLLHNEGGKRFTDVI